MIGCTHFRRILWASAWAVAAGCAGPQVDLFDPGAKPIVLPPVFDDGDWAAVLAENVRGGLVDYDHLVRDREHLDRFIRLLAAVGPESTPTFFRSRPARACYYINAYNACVLHAVLWLKMPSTVHDVGARPFEHGYRFKVDGAPRTLADLRAAALREAPGDFRAYFCLCDAALGSPRLFEEPFRPETLEQSLRLTAKRAMDQPHIVCIDHQAEGLEVWVGLNADRQGLIDFYRRQTGAHTGTVLEALMHMAGDVRRQWLDTATGYDVKLIPFDRRLNRATQQLATPY